MALFAKNDGKVLTHQYLLRAVWGPGFINQSQYLRVFIAQIRKKIEHDPNRPEYLITESGVPGYDFSTWYGLLAPAGTPKAVVNRLNDAARKALMSVDLSKKLEGVGMDPAPTTPDEFAKFLRTEIEKWRRVIQEAGIAKS